MDGGYILVQIVTTVVAVGIAGFGLHKALSDGIDKAKDAATGAREASLNVQGDVKELGATLDGFANTCEAHRDGFNQRIKRLESKANKKSH